MSIISKINALTLRPKLELVVIAGITNRIEGKRFGANTLLVFHDLVNGLLFFDLSLAFVHAGQPC